jgi:hypothetical protein
VAALEGGREEPALEGGRKEPALEGGREEPALEEAGKGVGTLPFISTKEQICDEALYWSGKNIKS